MSLRTTFCRLWLVWLMWLASGDADETKIVCYYSNWAINKVGYQSMQPSEIDSRLCTHLIYEDVGVTKDGDIHIVDPMVDLPDDNGKAGFQKFNALRKRNKRLKTLVSTRIWVGGYSTYSEVAANTSLRLKCVKNIVEFVLRYEFDGFHIDWQHWDQRERSPEDVQNYILFLKELRASFDEHDLILSIAVRDFAVYTQSYFDIPQISSYVDFISLDIKYHESQDSSAGHSAPLYPAARETSSLDRSRNVNATVHYWLNHGAPAKKIILGIRLYGIDFTLDNSDQHSPGSPVNKFGRYGSDIAIVGYNEICIQTAQDAWSTVWDEEQRVPYSYAGERWISYDNVRSLTEKAEYVQAMGLGGVTVSSIEMDDHWGECGERYPLLNTLNRVLRIDYSPVSSTTEAKVVCYYESGVIYNVGNKRMEPSEIDTSLCTHLIYAHVLTTEDGDVRVSDPWADLPDNKGKAGFQKFNALRNRNEKLKTLVSTGGWNTGSEDYLRGAVNTSQHSKFVKNVVDFLLLHEFDGFNMLWRYFERGQDDMQNLVLLLKEFRKSFDERKFILSIQVNGVDESARRYFANPEISKYVDFILLKIDYHDSTEIIGRSAPLYHAARETSSYFRGLNINASVHRWLNEGAPAEKLILGITLYGRAYTLENSANHLPGSAANGPAELGSSSGYLEYSEICSLTSQDTWTTVWDEEQRVPYSYARDQWISYENVKSLTEKGEYARAMGLGGVMVFSVHTDDHQGVCGERYPLLNALSRGLHGRSLCSSCSTPALPSFAEIADRIKSGPVSPSMDVKIVCYYESSPLSRIGSSRMDPSEIDPSLCTHLIYPFVSVSEDGDVGVVSQSIDLGNNKSEDGFQKFNALREKNKKLKILVSSVDEREGSAKYSRVIGDASLRSKYVENVVNLVLRHEFDGFDINWQYPNNDRLIVSGAGGAQNFVLLLEELRASFDKHDLILSMKVAGSELRARKYYDIPQISKYVDLILLQIQSHYHTDSSTGHSAPLYPAASETSAHDRSLNYHAAVRFWLNQGVPKEKLILGAKFYGISFALKNYAEHARGSPVRLSAGSGPNVREVEYNGICKQISEGGWTTVWDEEQRVPYSYAGTRWISYDNVRSLTEKGKYVQAMGLGGVVAFTVDMDDHRGECGERYPLLTALNRVLRESGSSSVLEPEVAIISRADMTEEEDAKRTCATLSIKYVRHPQNCAKFWICQKIRDNDYNAEPFSCGHGLYFDTKEIICKSKILVRCS